MLHYSVLSATRHALVARRPTAESINERIERRCPTFPRHDFSRLVATAKFAPLEGNVAKCPAIYLYSPLSVTAAVGGRAIESPMASTIILKMLLKDVQFKRGIQSGDRRYQARIEAATNSPSYYSHLDLEGATGASRVSSVECLAEELFDGGFSRKRGSKFALPLPPPHPRDSRMIPIFRSQSAAIRAEKGERSAGSIVPKKLATEPPLVPGILYDSGRRRRRTATLVIIPFSPRSVVDNTGEEEKLPR